MIRAKEYLAHKTDISSVKIHGYRSPAIKHRGFNDMSRVYFYALLSRLAGIRSGLKLSKMNRDDVRKYDVQDYDLDRNGVN